MKNILLVVATDNELAALRRVCSLKSEGIGVNKFFSRDEENYHLDVIHGGIGKAAMAFMLGLCYARKHYDLILNIGVAGSLSDELKPMDIFCATKSAYYDVSLPGLPRGKMDEMPLYFECDEKIVELAKQIDPEIKTGLVLTGDLFVTKNNLPEGIERDFDHPLAIDMESASVGESAYIGKVPYGILRTVSDTVTTSDDDKEYEKNVAEASDRAARMALEILRLYSSI